MQQPEVFKYATLFDLNMVYYTIDISTRSKYVITIVAKFWKFRYNQIPMGTCTSGGIFQDKLYKFLGGIKGVKTYIFDALVLSKESFPKCIDHLRFIFARLFTAGLKVDAPKCSLCLKFTLLVYIINLDGIKPNLS